MINTLVLAYIGGSLATTMLLVLTNKDSLYLFNTEFLVLEILQAVIGSIAILFTVVFTVFISTMLETMMPKGTKKFVQTYNEGLSINKKG